MRASLCATSLWTTSIAVLTFVCLASPAHAGETFTATAHMKGRGGLEASAPVTITVDRFSTNAERDEILAALKRGGGDSVRSVLITRDQIGIVQVGTVQTAIKFASERTTADGRLITVVTSVPIAFIGAGLPGAQPRVGYHFGLVLIEMKTSGPGSGELAPATKLRMNDEGAIVTEDYSADVVQLSTVIRK